MWSAQGVRFIQDGGEVLGPLSYTCLYLNKMNAEHALFLKQLQYKF